MRLPYTRTQKERAAHLPRILAHRVRDPARLRRELRGRVLAAVVHDGHVMLHASRALELLSARDLVDR